MQLTSQLHQSDNYPRGLNLTRVKLATFRQRLNVMKHGIHHQVWRAIIHPSTFHDLHRNIFARSARTREVNLMYWNGSMSNSSPADQTPPESDWIFN